jgi:glucose/arabinose dehydrogenase
MIGYSGRWIIYIFAAATVILPLTSRSQTVTGLAAVRVAVVNQPLFVLAPPGDYSRVFIVTRTGQISILDLASGKLNSTLFLNLGSHVFTTGERGLLGMAFDPNFATNGKFYLNFIVTGGLYSNGMTRVSQFSLGSNGVGDINSEKILLTFDQIGGDHNGGWIAFSPRPNDDNNLYISTGDGGCCNDQGTGHIEPGGNSQNLGMWLGKILRVHVDSTNGTYTVPAGNPFVQTAGAKPEIFAYGLRNPFRASFDRGTGRMFIGDVGQSTREEIDTQEPGNPGGGENYEWRLREGTIATPTGNPPVGGDRPPNGVDPVFDYPRSTGGCVVGGFVYRGKQIPALWGKFVFGDYVAHKIFALNYDGTTASGLQDITSQLFPTSTGNFALGSPSSLGEDANGELYICDIINGEVFKIVPTTPNVTVNSIAKAGVTSQTVVTGIGGPFTNVTIQATTALTQSFSPAGTATVAADGTFQFTDAAGPDRRFYRAIYP